MRRRLDQRFKTLIKSALALFLLDFFPDVAAQLELDDPEWVDKELFPHPPDGPERAADLVVRLRVKGAPADAPRLTVMILVEIESADRVTGLEPRLPSYFRALRDQYGVPVLPLALYLNVGLRGRGTRTVVEDFLGWRVNVLRYRYVGLPALDGIEWLRTGTPLSAALAGLMRLPEQGRPQLLLEAQRKIAAAPLADRTRALLFDCAKTFWPLGDDDRRQYQELMAKEPDAMVKQYSESPYDQGFTDGEARGGARALTAVTLRMLQQRFGAAPVSKERLETLSEAELATLLLKLGSAKSLEELGLH